jgi:hypothetical protein
LSERRKLNGRYGAALFGYFDTLTLELAATSSEQQGYVSSELEQAVNTRIQRGRGAVDIEFVERLSAFASASTENWRYDETSVTGPLGARLLLLERREDVARGGFRYRFSDSLSLGLGLEYSNVEFAQPEENRSNEGTAPLLEVGFRHPRFQADLSLAYRSLEPKEGSRFKSYDGATGRFASFWKPGSRLEYELYATRNIVYSIYERSAYVEDQRIGGAVSTPIGWRIQTRAFYEKGDNSYVMFEESDSPRLDKLTAYGGSIDIQLTEAVKFRLGMSRVSYDSNVPGWDRAVFRITTSITTGSGTSPWY